MAADWDAAQLACLQQASRSIGIPLSGFLRFIESRRDAASLSPSPAPPAADTPSSRVDREWSADHLQTLQQAARILQMPFSDLIALGEQTAARAPSLSAPQSSSASSAASSAQHTPLCLTDDESPVADKYYCPPGSTSGLSACATLGSERMELAGMTFSLGIDDPCVSAPAGPQFLIDPPQPDSYAAGDGMPSDIDGMLCPPPFQYANNFVSLPSALDTGPGPQYPSSIHSADIMLDALDASQVLSTLPSPILLEQSVSQYPSLHVEPNPIDGIYPQEPSLGQHRPIVQLQLPQSPRRQMRSVQRMTSKGTMKRHSQTKTNLVQKSVVAITRRFPCIRCSMSHKRCLPGPDDDECLRCRNQKYSMSNLPCLYFQITDIVLFRMGTAPLAKKPYGHDSITDGMEKESRGFIEPAAASISFQLTQNLGTFLELTAEPFAIHNSDNILTDPHGSLQLINAHQFRLPDLGIFKATLTDFILQSVSPYIHTKVEAEDILTCAVFNTALSTIRNQRPFCDFLHDVLRFWTAARMMEGGWVFAGPQTLGLQGEGGGPPRLTSAPFIDYQFSFVLVQEIMLPLQQRVLKRLHDLTYANKPENWFALFLANFILLHTYGLLMRQQRDFARLKKSPWRYPVMSLVEHVHLGAKTLLAHFHHICKGQMPFEVAWKEGNVPKSIQRMAKLSDDELESMSSISALAAGRAKLFSELMRTEDYESDHWFTGQLFVPGWKPPRTIAELPPAIA